MRFIARKWRGDTSLLKSGKYCREKEGRRSAQGCDRARGPCHVVQYLASARAPYSQGESDFESRICAVGLNRKSRLLAYWYDLLGRTIATIVGLIGNCIDPQVI